MQLDTEDLAEIRRAVRALCEEFPGEYWREKDRERSYPSEFVDALTQSGFLAALIPEEFGGSGLKLDAAAVIMEEVQTSGCNGGAAHAQMYIMNTLLRYGSEKQKAHYLPRIANGELRLQAFGVSEPTSGTDTLSLKTRAVRAGDDYIINGQKIWTSRAEHSDLMLLLARTTPREEVAKKTDGLSIFLIDMRDALENGMSIGKNQGVQFPIARCYAQTCAAELMVRHAAKVYDDGGNAGAEANMAKLLASEASWEAADMCVQTHGGFGFAEEYDVERKFREARLYTVAPISTNLILSYLAEHVLGLPRSY